MEHSRSPDPSGSPAHLLLASVRLGRVCETDVHAHWSLPVVLAALVAWLVSTGGLAWPVVGVAVAFALVLVLSVLAHELGHVFAARACDLVADQVVLHPLGGLAFVGLARRPRHELVVAAAGPAVNLALAAAALAAYLALGYPFEPAILWPLGEGGIPPGELLAAEPLRYLVHAILAIQVAMVAFNLGLAVYPLDGGRILFAGLWWHGEHRTQALRSSLVLSRALGVVLTGVGLWHHHPFAIAAGLMVAVSAHAWLWLLPSADELRAGEPPTYGAPDPPPRRRARRKAGPLRRLLIRWRARRGIAREQRRLDRRARVDALLGKISLSGGLAGLSDEEQRFLREASKDYAEDSAGKTGT